MKKNLRFISVGKLIIFSVVLSFSLSNIGYALDITLEWDANTQPDLDHYVVFWGTSSGSYGDNSENVDKSQTTYTAAGLSDATIYYFAVKAYDHQGRESDYSNVVSTDDSAPTISTSGGGRDGGCFIATAAAAVDTYCEALNAGAEFPPIEIQRVTNYPDKEGETFIILDGFHRWEAYKRNKAAEIGIKEWIPEAIDYKQSQIILLLEAAERNSRHGDRLTENDKKRTARRIAEADRKKIYTEEQIAEKLSVSRRTVSDWISDIRTRQNADRNSKIICLSRLGRTQEEIADAVGTTQGRVAQIINNGEFAKINNFLEQGRDMGWIAEHYNIDIPLAWALRLEGKTDQERFQ